MPWTLRHSRSQKREDGLSNLRTEGCRAGLGACPPPTQLLSKNSSPGPAPSYLVLERVEEAGERREREAANELLGLKESEGKFLSSPPLVFLSFSLLG